MEYEILQDADFGEGSPKKGETWTVCTLNDYGLRSDHERITGAEHINISRDGKYPFFTIPKSWVRQKP